MKIDLLHYAAPPVVGGVESVLGQHARLMTGAGHSVRVLVGAVGSREAGLALIHRPLLGSRHPEILAIKEQLDLGLVPQNFDETADRIYSILVETCSGRDLLIAHNVASLHKNLPLTAALHRLSESARQPRLVLWHHDLAWTTPRYRAELHDGAPWDLLRTDWLGAVQVVVSELRRDELCGLLGVPPERIQVIPNGVDIPLFLKLESMTQEIVKQSDLLAAQPLLLLPVRITPRKNIELALRVLAALRVSFPHAALVVSGPLGPHNPANTRYFEKLRSLRAELGLDDSVHFLAEVTADYLPDSVISDLYRLADALLFPSWEEGFGIPILEAGVGCLPIFCSNIRPFRELAGELVEYFEPDGDPALIAGAMHKFFSNSTTYQMRLRVRTNFTWEHIYRERIEPFLRSLN